MEICVNEDELINISSLFVMWVKMTIFWEGLFGYLVSGQFIIFSFDYHSIIHSEVIH